MTTQENTPARKRIKTWNIYVTEPIEKCVEAHMKELHLLNRSEYFRKVLTDLYFDRERGIFKKNPPC